MEWRGRRGSRNVEDRRSMGVGGAGGLGIVGTLVVLAVGYFFGVDISPIVGGGGTGMAPATQERQLTEEERAAGEFVSVVLADTEEIWADVLMDQADLQYRDPTLVLFSGAVQSACGGASAAMGPFYCPGDQKIYLDTNFFDTMEQKMGARGDFAAAYVVAHEVGHHVQNLFGILGRVNELRGRVAEADSNRLSVLTELQADCFAGIWARHAGQRFGSIEPGDVDEAINAARAVGDDMLMKNAGRTPMPDSFTHGSAADRSAWLQRGMQTGELSQCNTFKEAGL
ncbi:neutral zinc metallopeptidase [uncultured Paracoccus sp.]|uniref:KPN_02809 family neutral zinc metallopeptidase n=1 Tax=uncultured Paracoccus sp. TaxID=189685 RepID=UPI002609FDF6|nr:neutral zinc metallopeptidase [uncultured Paracoccus sp.]